MSPTGRHPGLKVPEQLHELLLREALVFLDGLLDLRPVDESWEAKRGSHEGELAQGLQDGIVALVENHLALSQHPLTPFVGVHEVNGGRPVTDELPFTDNVPVIVCLTVEVFLSQNLDLGTLQLRGAVGLRTRDTAAEAAAEDQGEDRDHVVDAVHSSISLANQGHVVPQCYESSEMISFETKLLSEENTSSRSQQRSSFHALTGTGRSFFFVEWYSQKTSESQSPAS